MSKQPPRSARIEIVPCEGIDFAGGPHFLRLRASNGATLCHSENYSSRSNARRAVQTWLDAFAYINGGTPLPDRGVAVREVQP